MRNPNISEQLPKIVSITNCMYLNLSTNEVCGLQLYTKGGEYNIEVRK